MSASMEVMPPGGHEAYATSIFSKIKTYLDSNPYKPVKDIPNTPIAIATFSDAADLPMPKLEVAIEPQQDLHGYDHPWVGGSGKNKFAGTSYLAYMTETNGTFSNSNTDTQIKFRFVVQAFDANGYMSGSSQVDITTPGRYYVTMTFNSAPTFLRIKHNGSQKDLSIDTPFTEIGTFTISLNATKTDPSIVGGLEFKDIQIESGSEMTSYAPYSNICPISGHTESNITRTGKNLWGGEKLADDIVAKVPNATKDTTNKTVAYSSRYVLDKVLFDNFKPNTIYTIFMMTSSNATNVMVRYTDGTNTYINNDSITVTRANKSIECIIGRWSTGTTVLKYEECGIFEGVLTAEDFEPYTGQTYNVEFKDGSNPLTVYGGTLDLTSGLLTVTRVKNTETFEHYSGPNPNNYKSYRTINTISNFSNNNPLSNMVTKFSNFPPNTVSKPTCFIDANSTRKIYVALPSDVDITTFEVVYELATPLTYQLTPTQVKSLLGQNNVWCDTGDVLDGKYVVQAYSDITSKISEFATTASKLGSSNVGSATQPIYLNGGTATACTYTLGRSVPSDAVFTDTKVTQTATDVSSNAEYEVLFSGTADNTTRTEGTRKTSLFTFNPQTNEVAAGHFAAKTDSPSGNKTANLLGYDIQLGGTSNTWDGTHTSLKDTITYLNSHFAPSAHDHNYLVSAGTNTQSTSSTAFALGSFNVRWFTETGKIPHQPSQWGFLLTIATGTNSVDNHQIFVEQSNGNLYHRGTNASSSSNPPAFKTILDSSNYTSYTRNSSNVIKVKSVNKTPTNAGTSLASPTPSIDTGYKFLCWLYVQSNGYVVGANYPGGATATNATWWFANGYLANYALTFYYLEIKDTI